MAGIEYSMAADLVNALSSKALSEWRGFSPGCDLRSATPTISQDCKSPFTLEARAVSNLDSEGDNMAQSVLIEVELPKDWRKFQLPPALHDRLQELLDRQDRTGKLSAKERREASALTELVDLLSLLKLRAKLAADGRGDE